MKKLILDEMNIKDIMNPIDLNEALYGEFTDTNIIKVDYLNNETFIDLNEISGIDMFNNDYVVLAKTATKMYLKEIPINKS